MSGRLSVYVAPDRKRLGIGSRLYKALEIILKELKPVHLHCLSGERG